MPNYLLQFINLLVTFLWIAIVARALLSWFPPPRQGSPFFVIWQVVHQITEPILEPIRRIMPNMGMIDLSPMVAIILLFVIQLILARAV